MRAARTRMDQVLAKQEAFVSLGRLEVIGGFVGYWLGFLGVQGMAGLVIGELRLRWL